ncbi:NCS2 family permease [Natronobacterium gregoryi]|uniref:Permease n=2 Tax=Natronobacterium gregoryi TaxID=44930 RepID=L0AKE7_NATGS|nr:NCS2 family permease [Natronobacterium gregoryi]AFZ73622.1 permease [Natronobacterium gregoryi SP2]ELY67905.1 xanthine/uracil/vitamin C permease [Natronobacterium gregoryi SP2]PLK19988.1 NCS2 family permease [Natronobacterium gregoryi SP2]SFJ34107.1 putative MFS transporter, AGZA family, xanthine/uracil permease [Natronobacterium gregoryi]
MGVADTLANYFDFGEHETDYRTETLAGITTFLAMAYIIVVNPTIIAPAIFGRPPGEIGADDQAEIAGEMYYWGEVVEMLTVVTILASIVAIVVMAVHAKRPFGLAPGMGLNAFFTFTVVLILGVPWQLALAAVFVEGIIFIALTAVGARKYIIELFPEPVKFAVGAGIGVFLLFLGLQEIQLVVPYESTMVTLGNVLESPVAALSLAGLLLTLLLYARGVRGSIVIGILTTAIAGWALTLAGVVAPDVLTPEGAYDEVTTDGVAAMFGSVQYDFTPLFWGFVEGLEMITEEPLVFLLVVFTFFFVDFFDTAGTLIGVSQIAGFLDDQGNLPEIEKPLMADAVGTTAGAMIGTSTVTTFIESSTGIEEGGRTGFTALVVGGMFVLSLLVVPLMSAIPQYATYIALVVVGIIMLQGVADIDWQNPAWAITAGLTITIMPLTTSIANGLAAGIISYPLVKSAMGEHRDISPGQWVLAGAFVVYFIVYFAVEAGMVVF